MTPHHARRPTVGDRAYALAEFLTAVLLFVAFPAAVFVLYWAFQ